MDILALPVPGFFSNNIFFGFSLFLSGSKPIKHKQGMSLFQDSHARGIFFLITLLLVTNQVNALDAGEVTALKDMQAEWGTQLGWTGSPSCTWYGVTCDSEGNVIDLYVLFQFHETTNPHQNPNFFIFVCDYLRSILCMFRQLYFHQLSGTIPSSIGNLAQLLQLYVHCCLQFRQQTHIKINSFIPNFSILCSDILMTIN